MEVILNYFSKEDLIKQIVAAYAGGLNEQKKRCEKMLADVKWASTDSPYHVHCRRHCELQIEQAEIQIKLLSETI